MSDALMPTYARAELTFERGQGPYLFEGQFGTSNRVRAARIARM